MSHFGRSGPPDITDTYSLLVLNITFRTTADDLFPLFDKYGKVVDIFIPRDRRTGDSRGFAFVRYKYADEAQKAVERLDGRVVDGREITVQFAKYGPNAERILNCVRVLLITIAIKEGLVNHFQKRDTGQEVAVLEGVDDQECLMVFLFLEAFGSFSVMVLTDGEETVLRNHQDEKGGGIGMIIEIGITGGEVAVEAWIGMIVINIVGGTEIIVAEVEAGVPVLTTIEAEAGVDMMMIAGVLVDRLTVHPLLSVVLVLARCLLGVRARIDAVVMNDLQLLGVLHREVVVLIPKAHLQEIQMLMIDLVAYMGIHGDNSTMSLLNLMHLFLSCGCLVFWTSKSVVMFGKRVTGGFDGQNVGMAIVAVDAVSTIIRQVSCSSLVRDCSCSCEVVADSYSVCDIRENVGNFEVLTNNHM
ncbi:hypothetical protein Pint_33294 [Pistacia integerrima]|uniref:Uncharacterized protein n=1 Tax=Pistacia integerrima TaxID=434235 RepID=A0ACC0X7T2_9ROSI|nr:hypothetical protein Pint_33294 [Pistacia integerrima]